MKTTDKQRRESLIDWRQVDFDVTNFNHMVLDDFMVLDLRLTQAMALLERAKPFVLETYNDPSGANDAAAESWTSDLDRFVKEGKE